MSEALNQAHLALNDKEIPVGAVIVCNGKIIAKGSNQSERLNDSTAHAEMIALTSAFNYFGAKYLPECSLYVTLEPCAMCAGAIGWAQISTLVYGADDPVKGYSQYHSRKHTILHSKTKVFKGIYQQECSQLISDFFRNLRN